MSSVPSKRTWLLNSFRKNKLKSVNGRSCLLKSFLCPGHRSLIANCPGERPPESFVGQRTKNSVVPDTRNTGNAFRRCLMMTNERAVIITGVACGSAAGKKPFVQIKKLIRI